VVPDLGQHHRGDAAVPDAIAASLRIACDALRASPEEVTCIGVVSHLPHDFVVTALVAHADQLADAYGFRTHMYVHEGRLDIRFERRARTR
jgi:hypothetical protein